MLQNLSKVNKTVHREGIYSYTFVNNLFHEFQMDIEDNEKIEISFYKIKYSREKQFYSVITERYITQKLTKSSLSLLMILNYFYIKLNWTII